MRKYLLRKNLMSCHWCGGKCRFSWMDWGPSFEMPSKAFGHKRLSYQQCEHCLICNSSKKCVYRYLINVYTYFVELRILLLWPKRMRGHGNVTVSCDGKLLCEVWWKITENCKCTHVGKLRNVIMLWSWWNAESAC